MPVSLNSSTPSTYSKILRMEAIVEQVKELAATADGKAHRELVDTFRQLLYSIERPEDTAPD